MFLHTSNICVGLEMRYLKGILLSSIHVIATMQIYDAILGRQMKIMLHENYWFVNCISILPGKHTLLILIQ